MSKESVIQLLKVAESDTHLLKQLQTVQNPEQVIAIAHNLGYDFSQEELVVVMQEKQLSFFSDELQDSELEMIVGGKIGDKTTNKYNVDGRDMGTRQTVERAKFGSSGG